MNIDGTIRAKVLQYKRDGNTLTEKWETLTKHADGIYYSYTNIGSIKIIFAKNGVFWCMSLVYDDWFNPESDSYEEHMAKLCAMYTNYEANILQAAANGGRLNKLHITVMGRLGHDVTPLWAAYEEYLCKLQEIERKRIESAEEAERELNRKRKEEEERRKAELLANGKERLMANKAVTVEQIELLAEAVGYKIHIRTTGFMRDKVYAVTLFADGRVNVRGYKLTQHNILGTAAVIREIAARIKVQAETEAQQPAETPKISTEITG